MSEKQFTLVKKGNDWFVDDNSRKKFYLTPNEVVKLLNEQQAKIEKIEKENRELNSIKKFAEKNGINIFLIEEAFRKCWKDNRKLFEENEQLRTQLLICQQSKKDDGRFQVWEVPPITMGKRISFTTNNDGDGV